MLRFIWMQHLILTLLCLCLLGASDADKSRRALMMAEQVKHSKNGGAKWHPELIKWAISLYVRGHARYESFRKGGYVTLPSGRQLQRYVNSVKMRSGIVPEHMEELSASADAALQLPEQRWVMLQWDEMYIQVNFWLYLTLHRSAINAGRLTGRFCCSLLNPRNSDGIRHRLVCSG